MKRRNNTLLKTGAFLACVVFLTACTTPLLQTRILPAEEVEALSPRTAVYVLPRTIVRVRMTVCHKTEKKGPFYEYGEKYLGLTEGISSDRSGWEISGLEIFCYEEADPDQFYVIESEGLTGSEFLALSRAGLVLDTGTGMPGKLGTICPHAINMDEPVFFPDQGVKRNMQVKKELSYKIEETDTGFVRVPYNYEKTLWKSAEEKAEEAANFVIKIRKRRFKLLSGQYETFPEGTALEYAVKELNSLEEEYLALFLGKTRYEDYVLEYDVIPDMISIQKGNILCWFSEEAGVLDEEDPKAFPLVLDIRPESLTASIPPLQATEEDPVIDTSSKLVYRIPDIAAVRVTNGKEILASSRAMIYQLGKTVFLSPDIKPGSKK